MPLNRQKSFLSVEDYLECERDGMHRHEYAEGDIYAMTGASRRHNTITFNISGLLHAELESPCQGYVSDMKVKITSAGSEWFYYPDVMVQCNGNATDDYFIERPVLIMEVVSPFTERVDKFEKRLNYQRLDSLQEYVLIHQEIRELWVYRRSRQWEKEVYNEAAIDFTSIGISMDLDAIYRNALI